MITLIHGNDIVSSRKKLLEESKDTEEKISLDGGKTDITEIATSVASISLFDKPRTVIIENLFQRGLNRDKEKIIDYLIKNDNLGKIIIWEKDEIDKRKLLKYSKNLKIINCQLPAILFKFLDSIGIAHKKETLTYFRKLLLEKEAELIYVMIVRQFRYLLMVKSEGLGKSTVLSPWQAKKFADQARYFTSDELIILYRKLLLLDYQLKTGQTPYNIAELLDIFLATL